MYIKFFLCFVSYFVAISNGNKVPFITPCKTDDSACLLSSAQAALPHIAAGIPDLELPPLDPLVLDNLKFNEDDLNLLFNNLKVYGTSKCEFTRVSVLPDKSQLEFDMHCPITAKGQYKAEGKLFVVPIEGDGDIEVKTDKILITVKAFMSNIDGHWHVDKIDHAYEPEEDISYRLDNLFGGNEEKSKPVHEVLNSGGGKDVMRSIGKPIIQDIVNKAKDEINKFLAAVPAEELFLA